MAGALPSVERRPPRTRGAAARVGVIWGLLALALYAGTCARGVGFQDNGIHQYRILTGQLEHPSGLALSHPLHYWLGRAALRLPLGEPALRLNLLSALAGAVGVGLAAAVVAGLTRNWFAASLAAAALLVAHSFWQLSLVTEVYTVAAALMTLEWYLLLRYTQTRRPLLLVAVFAVNGLHVADHQFGLLTLVTYVVVVLAWAWRGKLRPAWVWLPAAGVAWLVASAPYWLMILSRYQQTGDLVAAVHSALFGGQEVGGGWASEVLSPKITWAQVKLAVLSLGYSFPSLVLPVALIGLFRPARRRGRVFRRVLIAQTIIIGGFVGRYQVVDLYTFFVPVCALVAVWYGLGVDRLMRRWRAATARRWLVVVLVINAAVPPVVYLCVPELARERQWVRSQMRDIPYRDEYTYFLCPWRFNDHSAEQFARAALERSGPGGWLLANGTTGYTTAYIYQIHGGPGSIRVYCERTYLNAPSPDWPGLTDAELTAFLAAGGQAVVVPGTVTQRVWGERFVLDKSDPHFWRIRPEGAVHRGGNRVESWSPDDGGRASRLGENPP